MKSFTREINEMKKFKIILVLLILVYITFFSFLSIVRHNSLYSGYYDLGIMDQTVYNTYKGRILDLTNPEGLNNFKRMAIHNDIVLALLAPFYNIFSGPETLLVLQTIIVALGAIPIYLLSKLILKSKYLGVILGFVYLMYPPLQRANLFDFHSVMLAVTFLLFMFYFFYVKKYWLSLAFFVLSIFSKEQIPLTTGVFAFFMALSAYRNNDRRKLFFSGVIFFASILWFAMSIWLIIPYFRGSQHFALSRYKTLGVGPTEIIKNFLIKPGAYFNFIFNSVNLNYLFLLLSPLAFVSLFSPIYLLMALPEFMINFLSTHWQMRGIDNHYAAVIIPFVFVSSIFGVKALINRKILDIKKISILIIIFTLIMSYYKGQLPYSKDSPLKLFLTRRSEIDSVGIWKNKLKDENISVSASEHLGAHFSQRKQIFRFSSSYKYSDYVLILKNDIYYDWLNKKQSIKDYEKLKADRGYNIVYQVGDFEVYKKL
ncbi:MAG: hypothetical protein ACD_12C00403G0002 [uncultured bacterium]|nr:MAG: hypothetical protein ACD_12C00403G0002 [uncultured bacterium]